MKRLWLALAFMLAAVVVLGATDVTWGQISARFQPVATTDGMHAIDVNPSALAFGRASGLGYQARYDSTGFIRDYSLYFNTDNLGYSFRRSEKTNYHRLASSSELFNNFYLGTHWDWVDDHFAHGAVGFSMLYRPIDWVSVGGTAEILNDTKEHVYRAGLGLRPLIDRVTLTADIEYTDEEWGDPIFGVQVEPINGMYLGASYDSDSETYGLSLALSADRTQIGTVNYIDDDNEFTDGAMFVHLSDLQFRSPCVMFNKKKFYDWKMSGEVVEREEVSEFGMLRFMDKDQIRLTHMINKIRKLREDEHIDGILIRSSNLSVNFANSYELREEFLKFKETGKEIVFYFDTVSNSQYVFAASIADRIYMNPIGDVELRGLAISMPYVHDLLESLGIEVVNFQSHAYKTAGNIFSENAMTGPEREALTTVLDGMYDEFVKMIEFGRGDKLTKSARELIDGGPYLANQALELGLIDGVIYDDEIKDTLGKNAMIMPRYISDPMPIDWAQDREKDVAIIYAVGDIHTGKGDPGKSIGSDTMCKAIRAARKNPMISGLIVRVNSGGGSALASDMIAREIKLFKETDRPVIFSFGSVAGSGGYYIAVYGDEIIADPMTITGSIGVMGIVPNIEGLLDKIKVNYETIRRGEHADIGSIARPMTDDEKQKYNEMIEHMYDVFVGHVAEGRGMSVEDVHAVAQGRIWTGRQALERGLVDELGGLNTAIEHMMDRLNVKKLNLIEYPQYKQGITVEADLGMLSSMGLQSKLPKEMNMLIDKADRYMRMSDDGILYLMPYEVQTNE